MSAKARVAQAGHGPSAEDEQHLSTQNICVYLRLGLFSSNLKGMTQVLTPVFLNAQEVCDMLHISPTTLVTWRKTGIGPAYFRCGQVIRYNQAVILEWMLKEHKHGRKYGRRKSFANIHTIPASDATTELHD
jgi:hypothetical protein